MTISSEANEIEYAGNGSATAFAFPYLFFANADLVVQVISSSGVPTTKTITTDYTVTGAGDASGGTVTMIVAPASGETLRITRWVSYDQESNYVDGDNLSAETLEKDFDLLVMMAQQLANKTGGTAFGSQTVMFLSSSDETEWDGQSKRIGSLTDGVSNDDAATVGQINVTALSNLTLENGKLWVGNASNAPTNYSFGDGIETSGTNVQLDLAASGGLEINSGEVRATTNLRDLSGITLTKGQIFTTDGTNVNALAVGTNNHVLTADSAQTNGVKWAELSVQGSWDQISSTAISSDATVDITSGLSSTYDEYRIVFESILPATDGAELRMRVSTDAGSTFKTGASDYSWAFVLNPNVGSTTITQAGDSTADHIKLSATTTNSEISNVSGETLNGWVEFMNPDNGSEYLTFLGFVRYPGNTTRAEMADVRVSGQYAGATTAVDGLRFYMDSGNIASGTIRLFGRVK